ncbi:hypothetical protein Ancab_003635 [Ancistrocladus abbreviatus]
MEREVESHSIDQVCFLKRIIAAMQLRISSLIRFCLSKDSCRERSLHHTSRSDGIHSSLFASYIHWFSDVQRKVNNFGWRYISFLVSGDAIGSRLQGLHNLGRVNALNASEKLPCWPVGLQIHAVIPQGGYEGNVILSDALVDVYSKCGKVDDARRGLEASVEQGRLFHAYFVKLGFETNSFVVSFLTDNSLRCGLVDQASSMFNVTANRDSIVYNSMIPGYA